MSKTHHRKWIHVFIFVFIIFGLYCLACNSNSLVIHYHSCENKVEMFISGRWSSLTHRGLTMEVEFLNFLHLKVKDTHSSARLPTLESWLFDLLVVSTVTSYIISSCFCFLVSKNGVIVLYLPQRDCWGVWVDVYKLLSTALGS